MDSVATEEYWNSHWLQAEFGIASKNHPLRKWIEKEIENTKVSTCIEIGCYPGKLLSVMGEKGYELNGIDSFKGTNSLTDYYNNKGYRIGNFYEADFLNFSTQTKYDVVCSFGFIEHFKNISEILRKHLELLKAGGMIVIDVPNLNSIIYRSLYKILEPGTLENHLMTTMDLENICSELKRNGCEIRYADYIGHFYFRYVNSHNKIQSLLATIINLTRPLMALLPESLYKRYIGIIAIKI